jgi:hypothetical protein
LSDDCCQNKKGDVPKIELGEHPRKEYNGYRDMDIKKPFERKALCLSPEITKGKINENGH